MTTATSQARKALRRLQAMTPAQILSFPTLRDAAAHAAQEAK
jgi:hypothetical protein